MNKRHDELILFYCHINLIPGQMIDTKHPHSTQMNKEQNRIVMFICIQTQIRHIDEAVKENCSAFLNWFRSELKTLKII